MSPQSVPRGDKPEIGCGGTHPLGVVPPKAARPTGSAPSIPDNINEWSLLEAANFYHGHLGWAIHQLYAFDQGKPNEKGKKPLLPGWRKHKASDVSPEEINAGFGRGTRYNLGVIMRPPFVAVDLDSKPDDGESVRAWLASKPELAAVPRERTGGGAHLHFRCPDVPEELLQARQAPTAKLTGSVDAELYVNGLNLVLSPSIHKSGHRYSWEVTGEIPEVKWADLARWFGFAAPEPKKRGRPPKEKPWWAKWPEDLRTLDLVTIMTDLGLLGECLDPDSGKWSVRCPWESEHSCAPAHAPGSDTVIFNQPETMPAFRCLHAHCEQRTIKDLVAWVEDQVPGAIAKHCTNLRVWTPGAKSGDGRPKIVLPATGRSASDFGRELGTAIAPRLDLFRFTGNVVEIIEVEAANKRGAIPGLMLSAIKPAGLVTAVERTVETGVLQQDDAGEPVFVPKSMTEQDARITLVCRAFSHTLPRISRVLDVPVPQLGDDGKLVYPASGYDPRFLTWLAPDSPKLRRMGVDEAIALLLGELLAPPEDGGFWWHDAQARLHALARLITPFCRGLMGWERAPLWIYDGNREGCGKDTCANVTHFVYTGRSVVCAPLSKDCDEEMRKRITSALMAGARFFHLANMKGHVRYASLEAATDNSGVWEDRKLGVSENLVLPNETEFSFSANNATWEPDIERRCRRIRLRFAPEDVNGHRYRHANLRAWILERRGDLLSAINALADHWVRQGCPPGPTPFTSFTEWGRVVGGILTSCGLGDPCLPHEDSKTSGDQNTRAMRDFFELAHARFGDERIPKADFQQFLQEEEPVQELFDWIDFSGRKGLITFGKLLCRFDGRELRGILLTVDRSSKNRGFYQFSKFGPGTLPPHPPGLPLDAPKRGCWGSGGKDDHADIAREKCTENSEKENGFPRSHIAGATTSPTSPTSPHPVFCSSRPDLERVLDDLTLSTTDRIALDIETHGPRKGDGLDPWRGDIRLLTLRREGGPVWMLDLMALG
ncbi:MAG: bifunctional DNA primase/polymerase, partial [Verrucomicrobia bacterium]|nr:bifunctional DNA primase/polymerase [Verrucomicrobiota bacterium]